MKRATLMAAVLCATLQLWPLPASAQDCSSPPTGFGSKWWKAYSEWCTACGGTPDASKNRCVPGPNWGRKVDPAAEQKAIAEAEEERRQQEAEANRLRKEAEESARADKAAAKQRQQEFEQKKQEALRAMKAIGGELGVKDMGAGGSLGLKDAASGSSGGLGLKEIGGAAPGLKGGGGAAVQREQDEFDRMNDAWLKRQHESIREAIQKDARWKNEVLASIKAIRVPNPVFRPKTLEDVHPGDILLIAPDDSLTSQAIVRADPLYRAIDYFSLGNVSAPDLQKGRVSHALTAVRAVNGEILFLDHTSEGSRILNREGYLRKYAGRAMYVARPQAVVDGRELWAAAKEAALRKKSDYGLIGGKVVCSERAAIAVARATSLPLQTERHRLGGYLGPVDITPNDFFDRENVGKYFVISASPIVPNKDTR